MKFTYKSKILIQNQLFVISIVAVVFFCYDLLVDAFLEGELFTTHFILESIVFLCVSIALIIGTKNLIRLQKLLNKEIQRNKAISGRFVDCIYEQLEAWDMTPSEKEIAWLIIKGYQFSEIAEMRGVKENTTRLQATKLYAKADVGGRAEFVAEIIQLLILAIPEIKQLKTGASKPLASL